MALRRLIATCLLLCFVPASLASALPLVYCLGSDGHRAIELLESASHHCIDERRHSVARVSDRCAADRTTRNCIDLRLVPNAQISQRTTQPDAAVSGGIEDLSVQVRIAPEISAAWQESGPAWVIDNAAVANNQLAALKTIVLLI